MRFAEWSHARIGRAGRRTRLPTVKGRAKTTKRPIALDPPDAIPILAPGECLEAQLDHLALAFEHGPLRISNLGCPPAQEAPVILQLAGHEPSREGGGPARLRRCTELRKPEMDIAVQWLPHDEAHPSASPQAGDADRPLGARCDGVGRHPCAAQ